MAVLVLIVLPLAIIALSLVVYKVSGTSDKEQTNDSL